MKRFYIESGILVAEWDKFELAILTGKYGFSFSAEQWKNRKIGRTQLRDSERIAMINVLNQMRTEAV